MEGTETSPFPYIGQCTVLWNRMRYRTFSVLKHMLVRQWTI